MEKMNQKQQVATRAHLYEVALGALVNEGYQTEVISDGALIHLPDGYFAKVNISVCDASKFDLDATRMKYQEKLARQAALAEKRAEAARAKAEKAAAREAKKTEKSE